MGKFFLAIAAVLANAVSTKTHRSEIQRGKRRRWILAIASSVLIVATVGFMWAQRQAPAKVAKQQGVWASIDNSQYLLRLSGSKTLGSELAPQLVTAWLASIGASDVEETNRVGKDGEKISESLIRARLKGNPVVVEVKAHGSATAFGDMADGVADIGITSREVNSSELTRLMPFGYMRSAASEHVLGVEGIAVIVPRSNAVSSVSWSTLRKIFTGEITNWSALGMKSMPIHLYARDNNSGSYKTFASLVLGDVPMAAAKQYKDSEILESDVASDPGGIGFVSMPYVKGTRAVSINDAAVGALERRLYLYTPAVPQNSAAVDFVRFAISPEGQNIVGKSPFVADLGEDPGVSSNPATGAPPPAESARIPVTGENAQRNGPASAPPPVAALVPEVSTQLTRAITASLQAPPSPEPQVLSPPVKVAPPDTPAPQPVAKVAPPTPPDTPAAQPVVKVAPQPAAPALTLPVATTSHAVMAADYPLTAIRLGQEGKVLIKYQVKEDGSVGDCNVTTSSRKALLDDAACAMVQRHWKFKPAMQNGKPVDAFLTAEVTFKLH